MPEQGLKLSKASMNSAFDGDRPGARYDASGSGSVGRVEGVQRNNERTALSKTAASFERATPALGFKVESEYSRRDGSTAGTQYNFGYRLVEPPAHNLVDGGRRHLDVIALQVR